MGRAIRPAVSQRQPDLALTGPVQPFLGQGRPQRIATHLRQPIALARADHQAACSRTAGNRETPAPKNAGGRRRRAATRSGRGTSRNGLARSRTGRWRWGRWVRTRSMAAPRAAHRRPTCQQTESQKFGADHLDRVSEVWTADNRGCDQPLAQYANRWPLMRFLAGFLDGGRGRRSPQLALPVSHTGVARRVDRSQHRTSNVLVLVAPAPAKKTGDTERTIGGSRVQAGRRSARIPPDGAAESMATEPPRKRMTWRPPRAPETRDGRACTVTLSTRDQPKPSDRQWLHALVFPIVLIWPSSCRSAAALPACTCRTP